MPALDRASEVIQGNNRAGKHTAILPLPQLDYAGESVALCA